MELLHILRSQPDEQTRKIIQGMSREKQVREVPLYDGKTDYDQLVKDIFEAQKVICWW
jgi:hypothetical protein